MGHSNSAVTAPPAALAQEPLPCLLCDNGVAPGRRLIATPDGFDGECRHCCGTGHVRCMDCKAHPTDAPAVRDCDGELCCEACAADFDARVAEYADCQDGHAAARTTEAAWLALSAHETKYMELVDGERLALRTCSFCRSTLSRAVEMVKTEAA